jgi:ketosteroid isomerase-like protein
MTQRVGQITLAVALACEGCTPSASPPATAFDSAQAVATLRAADAALSAAVEAKDPARTAAFYAVDATLLPVAEPIVVGRDAIGQEWAKVFGIPGFRNVAKLTQLEVARGGSLAYTRGTYETELSGTDGKATVERGKWVTVWRQDAAAGWRIAVDMFNTDAPPPMHQVRCQRLSSRRPNARR